MTMSIENHKSLIELTERRLDNALRDHKVSSEYRGEMEARLDEACQREHANLLDVEKWRLNLEAVKSMNFVPRVVAGFDTSNVEAVAARGLADPYPMITPPALGPIATWAMSQIQDPPPLPPADRGPITFLHVPLSKIRPALDHLTTELGITGNIMKGSTSGRSVEGRRYVAGDKIVLVNVPEFAQLREAIRRNLTKSGLEWDDVVIELEIVG